MTENRGFAVNDKSRIQKAKKIISCIEFVMGEKLINKTILEIGAGSGLISYEISKYGNKVIAIDVQDISIKETNNKYKIKYYNFLIASGAKLPFKANFFDIVICNQVVEHIPKKYHQQLIDESYNVLKSNGIYYIATPNKLWPIEPHTKLPFLSYLPKNIADKYIKLFKGIDEYDVCLLTYNQLKKLLSSKFEEVLDLHSETIKNPKRFHVDSEISKPILKFIELTPIEIIINLSNFSPSWINIAIKHNSKKRFEKIRESENEKFT